MQKPLSRSRRLRWFAHGDLAAATSVIRACARPLIVAACALSPSLVCAQNPAVFSTVKTTSSSTTSLCVGCTVGGTTAAANSGLKVATITLEQLAAPSVTTNKLYSIAGGLYFNGVLLATGSSISGTTNTIGMFTGVAAMGNSLLTQSGTTVTMAGTLAATTFSGSGASLTAIPTTALTGNYVATVGSGTGITSSVTTGSAAATTITLNNTAVTPAAYGSGALVPTFTVDQQGRLTSASAVALTSSTGSLNGDWPFTITNSTSGTAARAYLNLAAGTSNFFAITSSQGYTTSGFNMASGTALEAGGVGGLQLVADNGAGMIRFYSGGSTMRAAYDASGNYILGTANLTDAVATPTISAGCGTGATIAGKASFFTVTAGTGLGAPTNCSVNFNATFANVPACVVGGPSGMFSTSSTTQVVASNAAAVGAGSVISVLCRGF